MNIKHVKIEPLKKYTRKPYKTKIKNNDKTCSQNMTLQINFNINMIINRITPQKAICNR